MRILFPLSQDDSANELDVGRLAPPYYFFKDLNFEIVLASQFGGSPMSSTITSNFAVPEVRRFLSDRAARDDLSDTITFDQVATEDFEAAYCLGAIGMIWRKVGVETLIAKFLIAGLPVAVTSGKMLDLAPQSTGTGLLIVGDDQASSLSSARTLLHAIRRNEHQKEGD